MDEMLGEWVRLNQVPRTVVTHGWLWQAEVGGEKRLCLCWAGALVVSARKIQSIPALYPEGLPATLRLPPVLRPLCVLS